ncbi:hypothetical protein SAMN05660748_1242 [Blastococcus aggregatus]|uniref:Uncharacterized protein n=1 Tax=Blastococcus aggregatus TaxID=38502 RepID=A0A285V686_9ACTN|nr:hypothetical protein [Blastococcus aggregatus]SOC48546.1 hypothetical protein SAMN05660748_1242 [Blastococcus aggregatus]
MTALIAGGFALLGVRWTQRHGAEQRRLDLHEKRRVEQRDALVDVLLTGREWSRATRRLIAAAHFARPEGQRPAQTLVDMYRELAAAHERALWTARVVVSDSNVWSLLPQLADHNEAVTRAMLDVLGRLEFSEGDDANEWDQNAGLTLSRVDASFVQMEKLTRWVMVEEQPPERRRRHFSSRRTTDKSPPPP